MGFAATLKARCIICIRSLKQIYYRIFGLKSREREREITLGAWNRDGVRLKEQFVSRVAAHSYRPPGSWRLHFAARGQVWMVSRWWELLEKILMSASKIKWTFANICVFGVFTPPRAEYGFGARPEFCSVTTGAAPLVSGNHRSVQAHGMILLPIGAIQANRLWLCLISLHRVDTKRSRALLVSNMILCNELKLLVFSGRMIAEWEWAGPFS